MRVDIEKEALEISIKDIEYKTKFRLMEKGIKSFASTHEALGVITEEYYELIEAVKKNDATAIKKEVLDIAVACNFTLACFAQNAMKDKM